MFFLILLWSDVVENSCKNEWTCEVFLKTEIVVIIFSLDEVWRQPYFTSITLGLDRKILTLNAKINIDCIGWWFPLLNQNIYAPTLRMTGGSNWFGRILEIKRLKSENKNIKNLHNRCPWCIFAFFWQQSWQKKFTTILTFFFAKLTVLTMLTRFIMLKMLTPFTLLMIPFGTTEAIWKQYQAIFDKISKT